MEKLVFPDLNEITVEMEKLWRCDKAEYERRRLGMIAQAIADAPESMRAGLLELQQEIDEALGSEQDQEKRAGKFNEYFKVKALGKNGFVSQIFEFNRSGQGMC